MMQITFQLDTLGRRYAAFFLLQKTLNCNSEDSKLIAEENKGLA